MNEIILPNYISIGPGSIRNISEILENLKCKKPIIITDRTLVELNLIKKLEESLISKQINYTIFKDTIPEPTSISIQKGVDFIKENN